MRVLSNNPTDFLLTDTVITDTDGKFSDYYTKDRPKWLNDWATDQLFAW